MIKEEEVCGELHFVLFKKGPFIILVVTLSRFTLAGYVIYLLSHVSGSN
jgi:hypothetical protein